MFAKHSIFNEGSCEPEADILAIKCGGGRVRNH